MMSQFALPELVTAARHGDKNVLDHFDQVCADVGAFTLTDLPISNDVLAQAYRQALEFFQLPLESKEGLRDPGGNPYIGWDGAAGDPGHDSAKRKQMYHIGPRISPSLTTPDAAGKFAVRSTEPGLELWPADLPEFTAAWHAYYHQMQRTTLLLGEVIAAAIGISLPTWRTLTADNWADLAANYYPAAREGDTGSRNAVHSDDTLFTVLYQDSGGGGGLRMRPRAGEWVDVPPVEGTYLVNIGELLAFLTGGRWWAVPHEVTVPDITDPATRTARVSIPFFYRPNDDRTITPFHDDTADELVMREWLLSRRGANA